MKKLLLTIITMLGLTCGAGANPLLDQINLTLLDHVSLTSLIQSGRSEGALLDSVVQIGHYKGTHIAALQAGFGQEIKPEEGEVSGASYLIGGNLRLSPFIKDHVNLADHWEFLNALEIGAGWYRDLRTKEENWALTVGLAFDPSPKVE